MNKKLVVFIEKEIRRILHNDEWWFSVADIVLELTDSTDPHQYIKRMRHGDSGLNSCWGSICVLLPLKDPDGKIRKTDCVNIEGVFRIIQSLHSSKAEPFKRWLAKVAYERVQEMEDPELVIQRTREIYRAKGYSDSWIEKRMRGIVVRDELADEWNNRGVGGQAEQANLTAEISKSAFGVTPSEYKELKGLRKENLQDHMTDLELIFSMLGEAATTEITREHDTQGLSENKVAAGKGGKIAGDAREQLELETGSSVVSSENFLTEPEWCKRLKGNVEKVNR